MKRLSNNDARNALANPPALEGKLLRAIDGKPKHRISTRAQAVWDRWIDWYGAQKMADFGDWPGPDLCKLLDALRTRDDLGALLSNIRMKHPSWPPTFAEIEAIARSLIAPAVDWSKLNEKLAERALATTTLTAAQKQGLPPLRWMFSPTGLRIPADGDSPELFISIDEVR